MSRYVRSRVLLVVLCACHLMASSLVSLPARAQTIDRTSPSITFEPLTEAPRDGKQVFSASVEDDVGVARVTLHHRPAGTVAYTSVPMTSIAGTDIYTATIDDPERDVDTIEFYFEARDEAGNRSIEGFAFDPLERRLIDGSPLAAAGETAPDETERMSTGRKVLYGVLGVIAVGALAAAAGGGGDSGGVPLGDDPGGDVPVTIVADPL